METQRPYTKEEYRIALEAVHDFHTRCYETVKEYLEGHGKIEINPKQYDDWRFDFLEYEYTITIHEINIDKYGVYLVGYTYDDDLYDITWDQINHDMVITEKIMDLVYELSEKG